MSWVKEIAIDLIDRNPKQPRERFDQAKLEELGDSLKARGLIQPISVRPKKGGRFEIVAGERRWRAAKLIGWETIKANVDEISDGEMQLRAIVENVVRADMNPIEEAKAFQSLLDRGLDRQAILRELGLKSMNLLDSRLSLLDLQPQLQQLVSCGQLPVAKAQAVALVPKHQQTTMVREIASGKLKTVEDVRHAAIAMRDAAAQLDCFAKTHRRASASDLAKVKGLETKVTQIISVVEAGFKNGECIAAQRVAPDRVTKIAEQLALIRKHVLDMEHDLRRVAAQSTMTLKGN